MVNDIPIDGDFESCQVISNVYHSFDTRIAKKFGKIYIGIVYQYILDQIQINRDSSKNLFDGLTWTNKSIGEISANFPYLSENKIRNSLQILVDAKILIKRKFSAPERRKTSWYALNDQEVV